MSDKQLCTPALSWHFIPFHLIMYNVFSEKYLVGDRQMSLIPVTISLLVSVISANTLIGVPAEMYAYGINYWLLPIGLVPACIGVAFTFVPLLYPLKITSCYEVRTILHYIYY